MQTFDWNQQGSPPEAAPSAFSTSGLTAWAGEHLSFGRHARGVKVVDETLRDGLQSVSGVNPPVSFKIDLLYAMASVGVDVVSVGLPAAGARNAEDCFLLCREIQAQKLPLVPTAAARTVVSDVQGIARAAERAGMPIEVYAFIGSSPIRHFSEGWELDFLVRGVEGAARAAVSAGLPFCLVTEDTTRSHPDVLRALFRAAIDAGASRLCLCDTTGHVTPYGVEELIRFTREALVVLGAPRVELDWHAHNDRGLSVATALWAASNGVHRIHGTGLGVGERVGNSSVELLIENLGLMGARPRVPRARLAEYCALASRALSVPVPPDHPIAGARFEAERQGDASYRVIPAEAPSPTTPTTPATPAPAAPRPPRGRDRLVPMSMRIGGAEVELAVHPRRTLLEALRYDLDLIGTKQGCDKGDCGACTVILDGRAVLSCLTLALDADGCEVQTVETLAGAPHLDPLVDCFDQVGGGQCGFCTPGMLMSATALLDRNPSPTREDIKRAVSGNLCRCTGYGRIFDAVELAAKIRRGDPSTSALPMPGAECSPPPLASNKRPARAPAARATNENEKKG
jgi:2-isopropylmalate synthase